MATTLSGFDGVETERLRLSTLTAADVERLAWLAGALAPDWRLEDLGPHVAEGRAVLVSDAAGEPIGAAVYVLDAPLPGAASLPLLAIAPARRFRGLGGEAGLAIERLLRQRFGVGRVFAPVPDGRGLAVYFWLRLGYRPLTLAEAPWPLVGLTPEPRAGMWLCRDEA